MYLQGNNGMGWGGFTSICGRICRHEVLDRGGGGREHDRGRRTISVFFYRRKGELAKRHVLVQPMGEGAKRVVLVQPM